MEINIKIAFTEEDTKKRIDGVCHCPKSKVKKRGDYVDKIIYCDRCGGLL